MWDEEDIVRALGQIGIFLVVVLKDYIIEECFSIKGLLLADYIKMSTKFIRQALSIYRDSKHSDSMVASAIGSLASVALCASWARDGCDERIFKVCSLVISITSKSQRYSSP